GGFNERNPLMLSLNIDGSQNWARSYPVSPSFTNYLYDIDLCSDGGYVTTGDLRPVNAGGRVAPIMKTDLYGDMGCFSDDIRLSSSIINMGTASDTTYTTIIPSFSTNASILPEDSFQIRRRAYCDISKPCGGIIVKSPTCPDSLFGFELSGYYSNSLTWSFENGVPSESVTHKPGNVYFEKEGTHQISVMPYNGSDSMHFEDLILWEDTCENIQLSNPTPEPYIPNIFSPNNDGMNDVFEILNLPDQFTLVIYNRWGEELFNTNRKDHFWDGTYNGDKVPSGVYYYILNMPNLNEQTHGYVHVVYE
ncbi:MAG: gliding motility-associated C-terminal domain-containing protein, partial [Flavobacteriales bacterium]|nr:gliding motility-associated C-terminal domain-containing protein [Flavobacteriales bacterium]